MQLIKKHPLAVLATVIVMFLVFFGYRLFGESAKVVDVVLFTVFSAALLILPAMELGDEIMKLLRNMEPKTGTGSGSVNAIEPYRQRSQREELEQSLVHALQNGLFGHWCGSIKKARVVRAGVEIGLLLNPVCARLAAPRNPGLVRTRCNGGRFAPLPLPLFRCP